MTLKNSLKINKFFLKIIFIILFLSGCATTPKQTVILSEELGNMIRQAEIAHFNLVDQYIEQLKKDADKFLEEKWIPDYMKEFTTISNIEDELKKAKSQEERWQILQEFAEDAAKQIYVRRKTIMDSLEQVRILLYEKLQKHYNQMRIANESITAHLQATSKVINTRDELLHQLKTPTQKILPFEELNSSIEEITKFQGKIENIQEKMKKIKNIFQGE